MDHPDVGERAKFRRGRRTAFFAWALSAALGCSHPKPEAETPAAGQRSTGPQPATTPDPAPGARPEERNRQLEAQWSEVIVKAKKTNRKDKAIVAAVKLVEPKLRLYHAAAQPQAAGQEAAPPKDEVIDLTSQLRRITPLDVDHIDILNGQVAFTDVSRLERPELWLHELNLSVENLTTRVHLTDGRPTLLTASGILGHSGAVSIFVTANAFEKGLTFSGRAAIVGLRTAELHKFVEPATDLQAPQGTIDIFVEFDCRNGELTGGVKPVLKNVEIKPGNGKVVAALKAWVADFAVKLFSDRVPERSAVATVIPIKGNLTGPDVQLWPALFGVMRNAFVEGLTSGYAHLPPVTSSKKESVLKQGLDALSPNADVPKAQPTDDRSGDKETRPAQP